MWNHVPPGLFLSSFSLGRVARFGGQADWSEAVTDAPLQWR